MEREGGRESEKGRDGRGGTVRRRTEDAVLRRERQVGGDAKSRMFMR